MDDLEDFVACVPSFASSCGVPLLLHARGATRRTRVTTLASVCCLRGRPTAACCCVVPPQRHKRRRQKAPLPVITKHSPVLAEQKRQGIANPTQMHAETLEYIDEPLAAPTWRSASLDTGVETDVSRHTWRTGWEFSARTVHMRDAFACRHWPNPNV